ncbi:hypothetical protein [Kutzneria kofuensis]|uniref:hypothetical protein n=1 Tax=Kutzneria kofuensis TaxID=103725 RepID=UPI0031ED8FB9
MRVLCTVLGSVGHANAVLPITRALVAAGHEVLYATTRELSSRFADEEGEVVAVLPGAMEQLAPLLQYLRTGAGMSREVATQFGDPAFDMAWTATGEHLITSFQALLPIAKEFGPDLVLRDGPEYAGCLVAEALGVPHVSAPSGDGNILDPLRVIGPLNERRAAVGLPEQADPLAIYRHGRIDCVPASCSFAAFPIPDAVAYQQPAAGAAQQQSLPRRSASCPPTGRWCWSPWAASSRTPRS